MRKVYDRFADEYIDESEKSPYAPPERYTEITEELLTESTGSPIGDYRDGVGAWQTDRMTEEEFDTMIAKGLLGQTDCAWK